jgi:hypothetical protein
MNTIKYFYNTNYNKIRKIKKALASYCAKKLNIVKYGKVIINVFSIKQ